MPSCGPQGSERQRAAEIARTVTGLTVGAVPDPAWDLAAHLAPDIEYVDHRTIGFPSVHGAEAMLAWFDAMFAVAKEPRDPHRRALVVEPDMLAYRVTSSGVDRIGGGRYEKELISIWVFGPDARLTRFEQFDPDREDQALARVDALMRARRMPAEASGRDGRAACVRTPRPRTPPASAR